MAKLTATVDGPAMCSTAEAVEQVGGIEEEWFFEGTARAFRLAGGATDYRTDGRWDAEASSQAQFRTRLLVVRPSDPARFNGTVIVNWNNVSAGESFEPARSAARRVEDGFVVVGVSAQRIGVEGSGGDGAGFAMPALKTDDPDRYGSLEHPGDDYSFDIFTQAAELLGPDRPGEPDPLPGYEVHHVIATGGSQSGARLMAYVNGVQPIASLFDGFLLTVSPNAPCALNAASALETLPRMSGPNPFDLLDFHTYLLRDDLTTPVILFNSEAEAADCYPNSQPDSDHVRVWEITGAGHAGMLSAEEFAGMGAIAGIPHSDVCFALPCAAPSMRCTDGSTAVHRRRSSPASSVRPMEPPTSATRTATCSAASGCPTWRRRSPRTAANPNRAGSRSAWVAARRSPKTRSARCIPTRRPGSQSTGRPWITSSTPR